MRILLVTCAALAFAVGGLAMKYSVGLTRLYPSLAVFVLFSLGAALQARAMAQTEMGVVYILVLGLEALAASLLSVFVLHERMTSLRAAAIVIIVLGIGLLQRS